MGRRSLVWRRMGDEKGGLVLSSVADLGINMSDGRVWEEVDADGIYKVDLGKLNLDIEEGTSLKDVGGVTRTPYSTNHALDGVPQILVPWTPLNMSIPPGTQERLHIDSPAVDSLLEVLRVSVALRLPERARQDHPPMAIDADKVDGRPRGFVRVGSHVFDTTGVLGLSTVDGQPAERAFPAWATLPSHQDLGTGRAIHFVFAWLFVLNGLAYLVYGFVTGHFRRDFVPTGRQWRHIGRSVLDHAMLRFPKGEEARAYNVLQKITYAVVVLGVLPVLVLAGWTMSPGLDAAVPPLLELFGGRQTARSIHFILAWAVVLFTLVHVALVLLSGVFNNMRSMITGWFDTGEAKDGEVTTNA